MAASAVRTHQQSRVESSFTSLAESRVVMPHASFSSDSSDGAGRKKWMQRSLFFYLRTTRQFTTPRVVNTRTASYFDDDDDVHDNKNNSTTNNSNNVLIVIRPLFKVLYVIFAGPSGRTV